MKKLNFPVMHRPYHFLFEPDLLSIEAGAHVGPQIRVRYISIPIFIPTFLPLFPPAQARGVD